MSDQHTKKKWLLKGLDKYRLLDELLRARGITQDKHDEFLRPDYDRDTIDPFLFADMGKAVAGLKEVMDRNERIIVFGDYDADGTCGAVIMHDFFQAVHYRNFDVYIPDRYLEGYGLKMRHVESFLEKQAKLIIVIDCGITNYEEIAYAEKHGARVIVLDHHIIPPQWPPAFAIINPKKEDETYPYQFLCGTALAFKFVDAAVKKFQFGLVAGWQKWLLDVVAIATVADMVPLTGENRVLLAYGLRVLSKTRRKGLRQLYKALGIRSRLLNADDIGFSIAPRINAASRMAHATIAYELLTTQHFEEARRLSVHVEEINSERKQKVEQIMNEVRSKIQKKEGGRLTVFVGDVSWPAGVLGIVANRLVEEFSCPCFVWGSGGDDYKGSCRSYGSLNIVDVLRAAGEDILTDFGGHAAAAGFSLSSDNISLFERRVEKTIQQMTREHKPEESPLVIDAQLLLCDVTEGNFQYIQSLEPFGMGNPKPLFLFKDITITEVRELGNSGRGHIKLTFEENKKKICAVGFSLGNSWLDVLRPGVRVDMAAALEENHWNGRRELRLRIEDIRLCEKTSVDTIDEHLKYQCAAS